MRGNGGYAAISRRAAARSPTRRGLRNGFVAAQTNTGHDAATEPLPRSRSICRRRSTMRSAPSMSRCRPPSGSLACSTTAPCVFVFRRLLDGRASRIDLGPAFPGRFRRHCRRRAGSQLHRQCPDRHLASACAQRSTDFAAKLQRVAQAVYDKCDAADGLPDGLIDDPQAMPLRSCRRPAEVRRRRRKGGVLHVGPDRTLEALYGGIVSNGKPHFPGLCPARRRSVPTPRRSASRSAAGMTG